MPLVERYVSSPDRLSLWSRVLADRRPRVVAEIGVYRGHYAEHVLSMTPTIEKYYMLDPWRRLEDWNKPANSDDSTFEAIFAEAMAKTDRFDGRRCVLRGTTGEAIHHIPDASLDFAYIDGDHTLRGITNDLVMLWPKMKPGGLIGGDDFSRTIWQHSKEFEPTFIFPFVTYFSEAVDAPCWALPHKQFAIDVTRGGGFHDLTGFYGDRTVRAAMVEGRRRAAPSLHRRARMRIRRGVQGLRPPASDKGAGGRP